MLFGLGLAALIVVVVLIVIGVIILAFILRAVIHWLPALIVAVLAYFFLHSLLWAAVAFVAVALLMVALRHR